MKTLLFCVLSGLFIFAGLPARAQKKMDMIDKEIAAARTKTGEVIICSPYGKVPGTHSVEEAAKMIRPGMILRLLPGHYNPPELIIFEQDKLIVESDSSGGYVDFPLYLYGKDCIVRNINIRGVETDSGTVIDTKTHGITITSGGKSSSALIANCAINGLMLYCNGQDITVRNTSVINGAKIVKGGERKVIQTRTYTTHTSGGSSIYSIINFGKMEKKGKVSFEKCMFFSDGHLFHGNPTSMKLVNLVLLDNLIWCEHSLFQASSQTELKTTEGLKNYFNFGREIKNSLIKPQLKQNPSDSSRHDMRPGIFIITSGPGSNKEYGCNMNESKGIPVPLEN